MLVVKENGKEYDMSSGSKVRLSKEWKIGMVSILILALFVWVGFFLAGRNILSKENTFYAVFDTAGGINVSAPVVVNGKKVGRVAAVEFVSDTDHRIKVVLGVLKKYPINEGTLASIESMGLMSGSGVVLYLGDSPEMMKSGDYMQGRIVPDLMARLDPLERKLSSILGAVDSILTCIDPASIQASLRNVENMTARVDGLLAANGPRVDAVMLNVESLSRSLHASEEELSSMIANFSAVSDTIARAGIGNLVRDLSSTLDGTAVLLSRLNAGEGSVGQFLANDTLYRNLENSSRQLNLLLEDLRLNPERYVHISVFGRKEKKSGK